MSYHRFIQTFSGVHFYPLAPRLEDIYLDDIAHALVNICRYGGHTTRHYSVAEHSVNVARLAAQVDAAAIPYALLHDATEAYLGDIVRPLKERDAFAEYRAAEVTLEAMILERFKLAPPSDKIRALVQRADRAVVRYEAIEIFCTYPTWIADEDPTFDPIEIRPQDPATFRACLINSIYV